MSYWVLPKSGIPISRTTVQRVTHLETKTYANRNRFKHYDTTITERFHEVYTQESSSEPSSDKLNMEMWIELPYGDKNFQKKISRVFDNTNVKEYDDQFTLDSYDNYINMELEFDQGEDQPE